EPLLGFNRGDVLYVLGGVRHGSKIPRDRRVWCIPARWDKSGLAYHRPMTRSSRRLAGLALLLPLALTGCRDASTPPRGATEPSRAETEPLTTMMARFAPADLSADVSGLPESER